MSDETQIAALKARITTYTKAPTLDYSEAKALPALPDYYVLVQLSRRATDSASRVGGTSDPAGRRLTTVAVAKSETNARRVESNVWSALHLNPVVLDGEAVDVLYETGGGEFDNPDEGSYVSASTDWIYVR